MKRKHSLLIGRARFHQTFRGFAAALTRKPQSIIIRPSFSSPRKKDSDQKANPLRPDTPRAVRGSRWRHLFFLFLLLPGCNAFEPAKRSSWAYKGHEYVNCPDRKMIKMCEQAGPYMICECAMR